MARGGTSLVLCHRLIKQGQKRITKEVWTPAVRKGDHGPETSAIKGEVRISLVVSVYAPNAGVVVVRRSVMSDSLQPHGLQHARPPYPSPSPRASSNSCPSSCWCHPTILSSVISCSSCLLSFPASGAFPMNRLFASGGQSIGASASVLPINIWGWFPLGLTGLLSLPLSTNIQGWFSLGLTWFDLLAVQGTLKSLLQHHSLKASIFQHSTFFMVQLSHPYMTTGKSILNTYYIADTILSILHVLTNSILMTTPIGSYFMIPIF